MATNRHKSKPPILPRDARDPTGADALERAAMRDFRARMNKIARGWKRILDKVPVQLAVNAKYTFQLDATSLSMWLREGEQLINDLLLEGGPLGLWFFQHYVEVAYGRGVAQEFSNLSRQSATYKAERVSAQQLLSTQPYQNRLTLIAAREFEEMKGIAGDVKANLTRILTDGMARGLNPRQISKNITQQTGIEARRANRIARTEITTALRRARMDEADEAQELLNLQSKQMHFSALSPTTRVEHAARHGKLFTTEEQRDWWASDANSINCKCTTITVLVGADGKPLTPEIQDSARRALQRAKEAGRV